MTRLSAQQSRFAQLVATGETSVGDAYQQAYPHSKPASAKANGCRLSKQPAITAELARLRALSESEAVLSLVKRRLILRSIAEDPETPPAARVSAIGMDSKLAGDLDERPQTNTAIGISLASLLADDQESERTVFSWDDAIADNE